MLKNCLKFLGVALIATTQLWSQDCRDTKPTAGDFTKTQVVSDVASLPGFDGAKHVMELAFTQSNDMFFVVKEGQIGLRESTGEIHMVHKLEVWDQKRRMNVEGQGYESGLRGITLHPDFDNNHWIFVIYDEDKTADEYLQKEELTTKVVRLTFDPNSMSIVNGSEKTILTWTSNGIDHVAGSLAFSREGVLHILTGDDTDSQSYNQFAPLNWAADKNPSNPCRKFTQHGSRESGTWVAENSPCGSDASRSTANTNDYRGKTLRIVPIPFADTESPAPGVGGTYTIPAGNLFPVGTEKALPEIYSMGHRAGWRINIDSRTNWVYIGEGGPASSTTTSNGSERGPVGHEALNIAHRAANFGWPYFNGDSEPYRPWDFFTNQPLGEFFDPNSEVENKSPRNTGLAMLPKPTPASVWQSRTNAGSFSHPYMNRGGCVISSGPRYYYNEYMSSASGATKLPAYYHDKVFFSDVNGGYLAVATVELNETKDVVEVTTLEDFPGGNFGGWMLDLEIGPDGAIYGTQNGTISKIAYTGSCRLPDEDVDTVTAIIAQSSFDNFRQTQIITGSNSLIKFPNGAEAAKVYNLKGEQVWNTLKESGELRIPSSLTKNLYIVKFE